MPANIRLKRPKQRLKQSWWETIAAYALYSLPIGRLCHPWSSYKLCPYGESSSCSSSTPYRVDNLYLCSFPFIIVEQSMKKPILIVDPFSTGALYIPALQKFRLCLLWRCLSTSSFFTLYTFLSGRGHGRSKTS